MILYHTRYLYRVRYTYNVSVCVCVLLKPNAGSGSIHYRVTCTMITDEINGSDGKRGFAAESITRPPKVDEKRFVSVVYAAARLDSNGNISNHALPAGPSRLADRRY